MKDEVGKLNHFVVQTKAEVTSLEGLHDLAIFAETNRLAFVKIVKKIQKKCGPSCDLQSFLQCIYEEPFLDTLVDEMPQAREELKTRLLLAGVLRESLEEETPQIEDTRITVAEVLRHTAEATHIEIAETNAQSRSGPQRVASQVYTGFRAWRRSLFWQAWIAFASVPIGVLWMLRRLSLLSGTAMSIMLGLHLLVATTSGIWYVLARCNANASKTEQGPVIRYGIWQRLKYADLSLSDFTPSFMVMKVTREKDETNSAEALRKHDVLDLQLYSAKANNVDQTICGCCLEEFGNDDCVALLPCGHVFCDKCVISWVTSSAQRAHTCPMCRTVFGASVSQCM
jgi:hypothetical protein